MEGTRTGEARLPPACDAEAFAWARGWPAIGWNVHGPTAAIAIGLAELLTRSRELFVQETTAVTEVILAISAVYFVLTFGTNRALDRLNERYAIPEEA